MATKTSPKTKVASPKTKTTKVAVAKKVVETKVNVPIVAEVKLAGNGRVITGVVVSDKMTNTIVIEVTRLVAHPIYRKRMRRTNKFQAHNVMGAKTGDMVEITECRPLSKNKNFTVTKIVKSFTK